MGLIRFVQTADLHLDRPFGGLSETNQRVADALLDATVDTFRQIVDFTIDRDADALLIAGDAYDSADRSLQAQLRFVEGLDRLDGAGIRTFICHGEHDPFNDWTARLRYPPLTHCFGLEVESVPLDDTGRVQVIGVSWPQSLPVEGLVRRYADVRGDGFAIGLLHGDVGASLAALAGSGIDYWALGGNHSRQMIRERDPAIVYAGTPQALDAGQTGPHGVYLVDVDEGHDVSVAFHAVDGVRRTAIQLDAGEIDTEEQLAAALSERIRQALDEAQGRPIIYRIEFDGPGAVLSGEGVAAIVARLNAEYGDRPVFAWCERATIRSRPLSDRDSRRQVGDVVASLLDRSDELQQQPEAREQIRADLAPLFEDQAFAPYRDLAWISDDDLREAIARAEAMVLAALGVRS